MAKISVRCSIPGDIDYHMLYDDITIEDGDYPQLEGLKSDDLVCCLQFLATRQIMLWHVAVGHYTLDQYRLKMCTVQNVLIPERLKDRVITNKAKEST